MIGGSTAASLQSLGDFYLSLVDLCLDNEEWSLVEDAFSSAGNLDYDRLVKIIAGQPESKSVQESLSVIRGLMERHPYKERVR